MQIPTVYLVSKRATPEQIERIKEALSLTPVAAFVVADPRDALWATQFHDTVTPLKQPIAIVADFENPLTAVDENGSLCPLL